MVMISTLMKQVLYCQVITSFKNFMQNETGPKKTCPLDITELSRADFPCYYLTDDYDEDNLDKYNNKQQLQNR